MNTEEKALIQRSFLRIVSNSINVADLFYANLFRCRPEFKALFKSERRLQGEKFLLMLGIVVDRLYEDDIASTEILQLAKRHVGYDVKKEDYAVVGQVLLESIAQGLGEDFNEDTKAAWRQLYKELSEAMIEAAY